MAVPSDISGLVFWVKADDAGSITSSGGEVSQWSDKSGAGNHVTQSTAGAKPKTGLSTINSKNVISFDSTDSIFRNSTSICANGFTVFTVSKRTAQDTYNCAPISIGVSNQGRPIDFYATGRFVNHINYSPTSGGWDNLGSDTTPTIRVHTGAPSSAYKERRYPNAEKTSSVNIPAGAFYIVGQKITLGTRGDGVTRFVGEIAENVVYDRVLTSTEITDVLNYLSAEWIAVSATGDGSLTLGGLSRSATGTLALQASHSKTLGALSGSGAGQLSIQGNASKTLGALSATGSGSISASGTASAALGELTRTASGALNIAANAKQALDSLSQSAATSVAIQCAASQDLGELIATAGGRSEIYASSSGNLDALSQTAVGALALQANAEQVLGDLSSTGTSEIIGQAIVGVAVGSFAELVQTANGYLAIQASSGEVTLGGIQPSSTATLAILGAASLQLGSLQSNGHGAEIVGQANQGSGEVVLQRKRVYIKRGKQYLIFNTLAEADSYVAAEEAIETARQSSRGAARRKVKALNVPKPEVVQAVEPEKLEVMLERFNLPFNLSAAISKEDFAALHYIQEQLAIMQDDEDIELLLLTL